MVHVLSCLSLQREKNKGNRKTGCLGRKQGIENSTIYGDMWNANKRKNEIEDRVIII